MIVLPSMALQALMIAIVEATHELSDETGEPHTISTISAASLRMAAISAVQIASGTEVWPGDKTITIRRRSRIRHGIFEEEG